MENKNIIPLNDDQLADTVGGYLQVSQWTQFLSQSIIPSLDNLAARATGSDRAAVQNYIATLRATCIPGAAVAEPVRSMWSNYNASGRNAIQDPGIRASLDQLLGSAYQYIVNHS